jgi:hypothetical protein
MVLASKEDIGTSPDTLDEPASVTLYENEDWVDGVTIFFGSALAAMFWMADTARSATANP